MKLMLSYITPQIWLFCGNTNTGLQPAQTFQSNHSSYPALEMSLFADAVVLYAAVAAAPIFNRVKMTLKWRRDKERQRKDS